ncbi:MAG TPA: hypothetical protein VH280_12750 [Verrucomicrobiae bacterium]|jgi:DNA-directed RNA polymerase subunit RPC12/RpoP|nr:hypothetical protein [Verrucomicrobiae bacterium]
MKNFSRLLKESGHRSSKPSRFQWTSGFVLSAGGILGWAGFNAFFDIFNKSHLLDLRDPLLGIPFRFLLPLVGFVELLVAFLCLFTDRQRLSTQLVVWLVVSFIVYRIGLWTMGWPHPWVFVGRLTDALNVSPFLADGILLVVGIYLLIGGTATFSLVRWGTQAANFKKMSCPSCGAHIRFPLGNIGQQIRCPNCDSNITLREAGEVLKMSCFFCKENIEFLAHSLGRKIKCPHCKMEIGLREERV